MSKVYLNKAKERFLRSSFLRGVFFVSGGSIVAQVINVAGYPILTRLYSPESFGLFALFTSFVQQSSIIGSLRYELGITSSPTTASAVELLWSSIYLAIPMGALISGIFLMIVQYDILGFGYFQKHKWVVLFIVLAFWATSIAQIIRYWLIRVKRFSALGKFSVWQAIGRNGLQGMLAWLSGGVGLLIGDSLGRVFLLGMLWKELPRRVSFSGKSLKRNAIYPLTQLLPGILNTLSVTLLVPTFAWVYGIQQGGFLALSERLLVLPLGLIGRSVSDVYYGRVAEMVRNRSGRVSAFSAKIAAILLAGALVIGLGYVWVVPLLPYVFGKEWNPVGRLLRIMVIWFVPRFVVSPLSSLLFLSRRMYMRIWLDLLQFGAVIGIPLLAFREHLPFERSLLLFSVAQATIYFIWGGVLTWIAVEIDASSEKGLLDHVK